MRKTKKGQKMKLTKIAAAILSTSLVFGCGSDLEFQEPTPDPVVETDPGTGTETETTSNLGARILDTTVGDTGELRIVLEDQASVSSILEGQVSATIQLQADADTTQVENAAGDNLTNSAFITLYSSANSSTGTHGEIIIISDGRIRYRDSSGSQQTIEGLTYTPGDAIDVVVAWDETTYSLSIDGGATFSESFESRDPTTVQTVAFRLGGNDDVSTFELNVDDIVILDQTAEVYSDDFNDDVEGDSLVPPYNTSSSEATSELLNFGGEVTEDDAEEVVVDETGVNLGARILDTTVGDTGELRIVLEDQASVSSILEGQVSATIQLQADADTTQVENAAGDNLTNSAFITLYSSANSSTGTHGEIIIISDGRIRYRDSSGSQQTIEGLTYTPGDAIDVVVAWDETTYSLSIDGGATFSESFESRDPTTVQTVAFRLGGNDDVSTFELNVDDIVILNQTAEVYSDDFNDDVEGDSLIPPYNTSSSEATSELLNFGGEATEDDVVEEEVVDETGVNLGAHILDTTVGDTGELRIVLEDQASVSSILEGQVSATIQLQEDADTIQVENAAGDNLTNSAFITLYSSANSSTGTHGEIIIISDGRIRYRDSSGSQQTIEGLTYTPGDAIDVVVAWDETTYSLSIDGGATFSESFESRDPTTVQTVAFRLGGNDDVSTFELNVDDIVILDQTAEVYSDDFNDDVEGDSLVPPYNTSSSEATSELLNF
ncbi:hypothetical protein V6255_11540 [Psychromonas arctica]|uniref:Uncharacterized protein n=1 Tax=Psychromonas arctica TaxID=168275 RepID=A0ABU9HDF0_9GAMM